jgi:hypothetical protein
MDEKELRKELHRTEHELAKVKFLFRSILSVLVTLLAFIFYLIFVGDK